MDKTKEQHKGFFFHMPFAKNDSNSNSPEDQIPGADINLGELITGMVAKAVDMGSSDIHIEPEEERIVVRNRVDGLLREVDEFGTELEKALIFKIKILSKLQTDEHFAPQDGRISFVIEEKKYDTRVSILPTTKGEKVVMRILSGEGRSFALEDLGLVGRELQLVQRGYKKPYGMILAVGPTGSGKTTTLYSILKILNSREVNITTVEDPVEYDIEGVNHVQINPKADLTFATGLRAILRQDPDIVMIGEIRDQETARIAINAALTGHLVLSTLHTNDAVTTIPRLSDMGVEDYLIADTVNVVIAQRLARKLCNDCKKPYKINAKDYDQLKLERPDIAALLKVGEEVYIPTGCSKCSDTGYKGRIGLYEVFEVKEAIRKIITAHGGVDEVYKQAKTEGLVLILEDGIRKVREGTTSISELTRVTAIKE